MAAYDPSALSPTDQAAFQAWQGQFQQYVAQHGGGIPSEVGYALVHPEYLSRRDPGMAALPNALSAADLRAGYDLVSGANLPPTVKEALKDYHPHWGGDAVSMEQNKGLFSQWETWVQLGLGAALGGVAVAGLAGPSAAGAGAGTGPLAGGYGAATTSAAVPSSLASVTGAGGGLGGTAGAGGLGSWFTKSLTGKDVFGTAANLIGTIYGANKAADLTDAGQKIQQEQFDKALAVAKEQQDYERATAAEALGYTRNQFGSYLSTLQPYLQSGNEANARRAQFMGLPDSSAGTTVPASNAYGALALGTPRGGGGGGGGASGPLPTIDPKGDIAAQAEAYLRAQGVTPLSGSGQYWAGKWPELVARGQEIGEPTYAERRLSQADELTGRARTAPATPAAPVRLRAPNGTEQDVPADQVDHYVSLGATRL